MHFIVIAERIKIILFPLINLTLLSTHSLLLANKLRRNADHENKSRRAVHYNILKKKVATSTVIDDGAVAGATVGNNDTKKLASLSCAPVIAR